MDNNEKRSPIEKLRPGKRKLIQLYAALLYNAQLKGFAEGQIYTGPIKNLCVPGLNCYSCPGAIAACPLGALQNALASTTTRTPAYMLGILLLFGLMLGRTICGFLCPFGLLQELLYKIPTPKVQKSRITRALSWLKYLILLVFVLAIPLMYALQHFPVPGFCKYICPAGTLEGAVALLSNPNNTDKLSMLGILFTRKFVLLILILLAAIFVFRAFCRFLCPLGAIYGLFCKVAIIGVKVDADKCTGCGLCVRKCRMDVKCVGDHECIHCGDCAGCCPTGAIAYHVGTKTVAEGKTRNRAKIAHWAAALILLVGLLIVVNRTENTKEPTPVETTETAVIETSIAAETTEPVTEELTTPAVSIGSEVGMRLPDFTAPLYGGGEFDSSACRGRVLVINFWATWCTPCVNELPFFETLAAEYADEVTVIALHSSLITEDVDAWLLREAIDLSFALDETGEIISSLGGSTMLPMTVIVNADGIITYNAVGSVTYETLQRLIAEAQ